MEKILVIRNDGIGDLVLTLPAISSIRRLYPSSHIAILVKDATKDLLWNNKDINEVIVDNNEGVFALSKSLYKRFDIAFILYPNWRNSFITFLARIPVRVGTGYKPCGILFNKRIYIHRTDCHETDWCLKIVGKEELPKIPKIFIKEADLEYAKGLVSNVSSPLIGIHPCCKGSALNWSSERYANLCEKIEERYKTRVIITGSSADKEMIDRIISNTKGNPLNICGMTNLGQLISLISLYSVFIGPSTGPMHIASCLGIKTIALFPPIRSQSPKKWHPLGENYIILTPNITCNEKQCKEKRCKEYRCMERINERDVLDKIGEYV